MKTTFRKCYGGPDSLEVREVPIPQPERAEVLVKVKATTVNRTDQGVLLGKPFVFRFFVGFPKPRLSATGTDFSGVVVNKGSSVTDFEIGDAVYGFMDHGLGTHAEYACIAVDEPVFRKPENVSHETAAASLEGAHYAYFFLEGVPLKLGDEVLVNGATGAIGNAAVQLLLHRGAKVTFTYPTDSYEKVKHLPAERMVDYLKEDFTSQTDRFDFILDAVGKSSFGACKHLLKPGGAYLSSELGQGGENIPLSIIGLFKNGKRVVFPFPGSPKHSIPEVKKLIERGEYVPLIDRVYTLDEVGEAFGYMLSGQKRGNVILTMNG